MDSPSLAPQQSSARFNLKLGVVTHVKHWVGVNGTSLAYEPYVREMRIWADLFSRVEIYAPLAEGPISGNQAPYERPNVFLRQMAYNGTDGGKAKLIRLCQAPGLTLEVIRLMRRNDLIQLRSPGHPALIGSVVARLLGSSAITKYAGLFDYFEGERLTARFERWLLRRPSTRHYTLIYGPSKAKHLVSFQPALMDNQELLRAKQLAERKTETGPFQLIAVGSLIPVKGFDLAVRGLGELWRKRPDLSWKFTLVGDGPETQPLRDLASKLGIEDRVTFTGALPFAQVQRQYARAHVLIMPGVKEGWPKTIAEAWAHRAIPVAAAAGLVPWILKEDAGLLFEPDPEGLADALAALLDDPNRMNAMASKLTQRAQNLSLDSFKESLENVLVNHFNFQ